MRSDLTPNVVADLSSKACARLLRLDAFLAARHVVVYAPLENEVDTAPIVAAGAEALKLVYYPRVAGGDLDFVCAEPTTLRPGAFGVQEPSCGSPLSHRATGVVFVVPGLAFDLRGGRLGRGAAHYDRALARYRGATRIGFGYEFQLLPLLPEAPWDTRMHVVVTDGRVVGGDGRCGSL